MRPPPIYTLFPYTTLFRSEKQPVPRIPARSETSQSPPGNSLATSPSTPRSRKPLPERSPIACRRDRERKSTRLNSSHVSISYAVLCIKKKKKNENNCDLTK